MARCFAVAISQAPGLSGTPDLGHCSSAATRASCARSSARPTSCTIRMRLAMSLGDSILQTASMVRWVSVATATQHTIFNSPRASRALGAMRLTLRRARPLLYVLSEVLRPEYLANLGLALPSGPVFLVK